MHSSPFKLAILTTHPIQYQVPWFRRLAQQPDLDLTVFFCQIPDAQVQGDGFGVAFQWDVPLLDGYRHVVLRNVARAPSVTRFGGCDTPEIAARIRDGGFDALVVNGWVVRSCLQALFACRRHGVPCIVRGESNTMRRRPWHKRLVHRWLLRQYAAFLAIGKSNEAFYRRHGVPAEHIFRTPYCVENERFAEAAGAFRTARDAHRAAWGIPADACVFLFCGKLIPKKRPADLLEALDRLISGAAPLSSAVHALIAGDGDLRTALARSAQERRLPVSFAGFLNQRELPKAYAVSDCLVLPSDDGETWGLVVNEAMACGLPAVVSDRVGCHPDLVAPGKTGTVFPCGDVAALADALRGIAQSSGKRRALGQNANALVCGAFNYDAVAAGTLDAVRYVTRRRGKAAGG